MIKNARVVQILLADNQNLFREGLQILLDEEPGFHVVADAADKRQTLRLAKKFEPDVLILGASEPHLPGIKTLRSLSAHHIRIRTLLLCDEIDAELIDEAFQIGACAMVLTEASQSVLFEGIRCIASGKFWIDREVAEDPQKTLQLLKEASLKKTRPRRFGLTPREVEIISAVASSYTNREIALRLSISEQTVKHHLTNIFDKLGVYNRLELVLHAVAHGLVGKREPAAVTNDKGSDPGTPIPAPSISSNVSTTAA